MPGRTAAFLIAATFASIASAPAAAQDAAHSDRIITAEVYGEDLCPVAKEDEIVVCKRLPEGERYRLPKRFRKATPRAGNAAWATRVETMDAVGREAGGLPNTCSVIGSGGQTGCTQAMLNQWFAERRAAKAQPR